MQCPSCEHEAPQSAFGDPLRCPDCGAFYEKAVALKLQKELAAQREQIVRLAPPAPPPPPPQKKKTRWVLWFFVAMVVIGVVNVIVNPPPPRSVSTPAASAPSQSVPKVPAAPPVRAPDPVEDALADVKLEYKWGKKHDTLMVANFIVINNGYRDVKDIEIECVHSGPSGTRIDSNKRTIYELVPARSRKVFNGFDMGFIHSQAVSSLCTVVDLKI